MELFVEPALSLARLAAAQASAQLARLTTTCSPTSSVTPAQDLDITSTDSTVLPVTQRVRTAAGLMQ